MRHVFAGFAVLATLWLVPGTGLGATAQALFVPDPSRATRTEPGVRQVPLRFGSRQQKSLAQTGQGDLLLPLADGGTMAVPMVDRSVRDDGLVTWIGEVLTPAGPRSVVLTLGDNLAFGWIPQPDGSVLVIDSTAEGPWLRLPEQGLRLQEPAGRNDAVRPPAPDAASRSSRVRQDQAKSTGVPVLDVLVVYTGLLAELYGGHDVVEARIAHLEALSNQAYADSGAAVRVRVVGRHLVDYAFRNDNGDALQDITDSSSKAIKQEVDRLRVLYGADLVAMLRHADRIHQTNCGIAHLQGYQGSAFDPALGFSVSADRGYGGVGCTDWTFTHELGHNMGAHHDDETTGGEYGAYPWSRGYRRRIDSERGFATIMAYTEAPLSRLGFFSSPQNAGCMGQACGMADRADNVRGIGQAAPSLAAFYSPPANTLPGIRVSDVRHPEGNAGFADAVFTVSLSAPAPAPVTFDAFTSNGSAVQNVDYQAVALANLVIPAGQSSTTVRVPVRGETLVENDEIFSLNLDKVRGARVVDGQGVATILNDEALPGLSVANTEVVEGDAGTREAVFTARLSAPSTGVVFFDIKAGPYAASPFAATEDVDFQPLHLANLRMPAGTTELQFGIPVVGDTVAEEPESFYVVVSFPRGAAVTDGFAAARILDDDSAPSTLPTLELGNAQLLEGDDGSREARLPVFVTPASNSPIHLDLRTVDREALAGLDYEARQWTAATLPAGTTAAWFSVPVIGDADVEINETFMVQAENVQGAKATRPRGYVTVLDDDGPASQGRESAFEARDDRYVLAGADTPRSLDVLDNDAVPAGEPAVLAIQQAPGQGTASVDTRGTAGAADDRIVYTPAPAAVGDDQFDYRICPASGDCRQARVRLVLRPVPDQAFDSPEGAGFADIPLKADRDLPRLRLQTSELVAARAASLAPGIDPSPESPWDLDGAGTQVLALQLPGGPADTGTWRIVADARSLVSGDVDLYLGIDLDGNGQPRREEVRCVAAMGEPVERCEMGLVHDGGDGAAYWAMVHNRGSLLDSTRLEVFEVPPDPGGMAMRATGPGRLLAGETHPLRVGWRGPAMLPGESRLGFVRVFDFQQPAGAFPVRIDRNGAAMPAVPLASGETLELALAPGAAQDRLFIDVPVGATRLDVQVQGDQDLQLHLARYPVPPAGPGIVPAPARASAAASASGSGGVTALTLSGAALEPGRWYLTPTNPAGEASHFTAQATLAGGSTTLRPGSYFNPARGGHGLFLYPAGPDWAGLWYTYFQDGTPTWYYLQGPAPGGQGLWEGELYRAAWSGGANTLVQVGRALATAGEDGGFQFTYTVDGESGSERLVPFGSGCPSLGGMPVDASSHWFDPATAGTGYSLQLFPDYEFHAAFVYDQYGVPRFLTAESGQFAGADAVLALEQLQGFCPLCARSGAPQRSQVGTLRRRFENGGLVLMAPDAVFVGGVPGAWSASDDVQLLGGPGTTQGCARQ